jgi:hypothetical protein
MEILDLHNLELRTMTPAPTVIAGIASIEAGWGEPAGLRTDRSNGGVAC